MANLKVACMVAVVCMIVVSSPLAHAITCTDVIRSLTPCLGYLRSGGSPLPACCSGVRGLNSAAKTTADRQTTCNCLKSLANNGLGKGLNPNIAALLPGKCGVNIPYKISTSTNCATYASVTTTHSTTSFLTHLLSLHQVLKDGCGMRKKKTRREIFQWKNTYYI
ncbi:unnamed protein product [Sphenostylis stenocarpa]|uniref:Non-specific lipid-transfer protein n=1 Tax=Sphenostylis stenocarpa TaxID=92480 RepID=A0AA86SPI4_9FABA|nr:unnamed protein product [Sphenostylis stenocarpa]